MAKGLEDKGINNAPTSSDPTHLTKAQLLSKLERREQELRELAEIVKQLFKNIPTPMHLLYVREGQ